MVIQVLLASPAGAVEPAFDPQLEAWLESDQEPANYSGAETLELQAMPPGDENKPVLHSVNQLLINEQSMATGWVELQQCYRNLDAVPDAEIQYAYRAIRNLKITSSVNIDKLSLDKQLVRLTGVGQQAELCIQADVRILYVGTDGSYRLRNGPFHRRFLDSYFPYRVSLQISFPPERLAFRETRPPHQVGFTVRPSAGTVSIDAYFTGVLETEVVFDEVD